MLHDLSYNNPNPVTTIFGVTAGDFVDNGTDIMYVAEVQRFGAEGKTITKLNLVQYYDLVKLCKQDAFLRDFIGADLLADIDSWELRNRIIAWCDEIGKHIMKTYTRERLIDTYQIKGIPA